MSVISAVSTPNPWVRILESLEKKISRHSYDTWLKPTRYSHCDDHKIFVRVPTPEFQHIGEKYGDLIQEAIDNLGMQFEEVEFVAAEVQAAIAPQFSNPATVKPQPLRRPS